MKIGIISSGNETLSLFKILSRYDNEYLVYHDQIGFPYGWKSLSFVEERMKSAIEFLKLKGAELIIVDPVYELYLLQKGNYECVMPLFREYLHEYAFRYSLVGKIGILAERGVKDQVQEIVEKEQQNYNPVDTQKQIKKFRFPFDYRVKDANSWSLDIQDLGCHNPYLIRTMKNDLRYFKDAGVDTILPMTYNYFNMQRHIKSFFNFRKTRFHDFSVLEECFNNLVGGKGDKYSVSIRTNQSASFITSSKNLLWTMQRGKTVELKIEEI